MKDKLLNKLFIKFLIKIALWTIICPFAFLFFIYAINYLVNVADFQIIYDISPKIYYFFQSFYRTFYWEDEMLLFLGLFIWLIGIIIIVFMIVKKLFKLLNALSKASQDILNNDIPYIELPIEFQDLQKQINTIKTESIKNENLAKENEQRKNDLVVYLAHDLKTPLTSLIGYLSLLSEIKDMPSGKREKYIDIALDKSYKLEDLINELFEITRFNSETILLEKVDINLNIMLEQIIDDFYPLLKEQDKEIILNSKNKYFVEGDSDKLARVFSNLIKNAIYYSTDKNININVRKIKKEVEIVISNKGDVIPKEKLNKIFDKFYRIDTSRTTKTGGSGLGLAIAKEIVELHKGTIKATSDKEATKFYVTLPINEEIS